MTRFHRMALGLFMLATVPASAQAPKPMGPKEHALLDAVMLGDVAKVKALLEQGASPEARNPQNDRTALFFAAEKGQLAIVELLLVHKANIQARDKERGETPVGAASRARHAPVVRALLARNAGPDAVATAAANAVYQDSADVLQVALGTRKLTPEDLSLLRELAERQGSKAVTAALEGAGVSAPSTAAGVAPAILEKYAGRYVDAAGTAALTFSAKDGALQVAGALGPAPIRLAPMTPRMFTAAAGTPFRARFEVLPSGAVGSVTLRFVGSESTYQRERAPSAPPKR
jgi:ankyrin repeat protein